MKTVIWWLRRDLRLQDNQALMAALEQAEQVIPLFILDPKLINSPYASKQRTTFMLGGLKELDQALQERGSKLILKNGDPQDVLFNLIDQHGVETIFAEADFSPYASKRDEKLSRKLPLHWVGGPSVLPPGTVLNPQGNPYTIFTLFSKAWKAHPLSQIGFIGGIPEHIASPGGIVSEAWPDIDPAQKQSLFPPGENKAHDRLRQFIFGDEAKIYTYNVGRNRLDWEGTSGLSPYLRFGMLSPRIVVQAARQAVRSAADPTAAASAETWLNELIWREFFIHILYHFPRVRQENFRLTAIPWQDDPRSFEAWCQGLTGYPVVDAAMRQLNATGWMHNRARMITASFLSKDLLLDWRLGERWFMNHLLDGDPASNNGGWQWTAGTGTDAAPYFRIFNPISQGQKHDPEGIYIRRWIPELQLVPLEYLHAPWMMPSELQRAVKCIIGKDYPAPIVDHHTARERALIAYGKAGKRKQSASG